MTQRLQAQTKSSTYPDANKANHKYTIPEGSGCRAVDIGVTSDTRGPEFEFSHRSLLLHNSLLLTVSYNRRK